MAIVCLLDVNLFITLHLNRPVINTMPEQSWGTYPVLLEKCSVLLRQLATTFVVIDTLSAIAALKLVPDDAGFHSSNPGFTHMCVTGSNPC